MESGKETQNNSEAGYKTEQPHAGDEKPPTIPPRQPMIEGETATSQKDHYFSKFGNWVTLLTLLFVAAYTVITFIQWRSNHIFNKKQLRSINAQLSEMRDEQRPWIYAAGIKLADRLSVDANGIRISLLFRVTNVGHLPATQTDIALSALPAIPSHGEKT